MSEPERDYQRAEAALLEWCCATFRHSPPKVTRLVSWQQVDGIKQVLTERFDPAGARRHSARELLGAQRSLEQAPESRAMLTIYENRCRNAYDMSDVSPRFIYPLGAWFVWPTFKELFYVETPDVSYDPESRRQRLHSDSGPAVTSLDVRLWYIRGVNLGQEHGEQIVLCPETQTIDQINDEINAEIKRIRIERYGWERYLADSDAIVIHERRNDVECTLESLMQTGSTATPGPRVLVCACPSTGRVYCLEVPMVIQTCEQAQRWLWADEDGRFNIIGRA